MQIPPFSRNRPFSAVLACVSSLCFQGTVRADNLVSNSGFESNQSGWELFVPVDSKEKNCRDSITAEAPHSGTSCLKMEAGDFARFAVGTKSIRVAMGERYRVVAWVRGSAETRPGTAGFAIRLTLLDHGKDTPGGHLFIGLDDKVCHGPAPVLSRAIPGEWSRIEAVVQIPEGVDSMGPSFFFWEAKGAAFIDDVSIEKVGEDTPLSPKVASGRKGYNQVPQDGPSATETDALSALNLDAPGMEALKAAAAKSGSQEEIKKAYLEYRRAACPAKWQVSPAEKPTKAKAEKDAIGDQLCEHIINDTAYHLYPDPVDMGKDFDWSHNPRVRSDPGYTEEWTWGSISRMHFWKGLANAYWNTLDEKYAQEWVAQLLDFTKKNNYLNKPVAGKSTLWRTLDASERMDNSWPYAYYHFLNSPAFTPEAQWVYLRSILDHIDLLKKGLETPGRSGNWVASECFGLYSIAVLFPELKDAPMLREFALNRLLEEINCTVPPDGFEAELTPGYHYFSLSSLAGPMKLARLNNLPVPDAFRAKLLAMYLAPITVMDQNGITVATNDSGPSAAAAPAQQALKLLGDDPTLKWAATGGKEGKALPTTTMLPYAGFYAMRGGWNRNDTFLFFRAGPAGIGHQHEDMLQVVMRAWNKTLLLEPATYAYDHSEWRRYVLNTPAHNTIIVDGKWQHRGSNKPPVTEPVHNPWHVTPLFDYVAGCYNGGYQENVYNPEAQYSPEKWVGEKDFSVSHTRRVLFLKPYYALLVDTLDGTGKHQYDAHFHLDAPAARLDETTKAAFSENEKGEGQLALYPLDREGLNVDIVQGQKEPMLGWVPSKHRAIPTVRFRKTQEAPALFATFLYPYKGEAPHFEAAPLPMDKAFWASTLKTGYEDAEVVVAKDGAAHDWKLRSGLAGAFKTKAAGMVVRRIAKAQATVSGAWEISSFDSKTCRFTLSEPATLVWSCQGGNLLVSNANNAGEVRIKVAAPFAREAVLPAGAWVELSKTGEKPSASPLDNLNPAEENAAEGLAGYSDYVKQFSDKKTASEAKPIRIGVESMALPKTVSVIGMKTGAEGASITGWNDQKSAIAAKVNVPASGWYRLKLRYCAQGRPVRSVSIGGAVPFAEAAAITLPSTLGEQPSDGWSNAANDWREIVLGSDATAGGWKFFLPGGETSVALKNEDGSGCNVNWLELVPAIQ